MLQGFRDRSPGWLVAFFVSLGTLFVTPTQAAPEPAPMVRPTAAGSELPKSGSPFALRQQEGAFWLVRPSGERFFSLGVCGVNQGASREKYDPENPGYAAWRHYTNATHWADTAVSRLNAWGFTTVGAWSDFQALCASPVTNLVLTPVLHLGSTAGAPWWDMWSPKVVSRMEETAREQILAVRDDPRLLGYYTDNELGWWNAALFKMTLEQAPDSGQRQRLLQLLQQRYEKDWARLLQDFKPSGAASWKELEQAGMLYLRPGGRGIQVMRQFLGVAADRYYALARQIIRRYDRRALILGDRYQSFYYPEVVRAAAPYVDAISSNLNASWNDGLCVRFYLDTLHALSGKPVLVSEFYAAAYQNRSGNKNNRGLFPVVSTQQERSASFRQTVTALLGLPYVVGADWFQYYDEPTHGREDGENFNFGLVDIHDQPYDELVAAAQALALHRCTNRSASSRADAAQGVPPAPPNPLSRFEPMLALKSWDRQQGWVRPATEFPLADLYLCWSEQSLYLGLYALDIVEDAYYNDGTVPKSDRSELTVLAGGADKPFRVRLGAGREPIPSDATVQVVNLSELNHQVRNIAGLELPARFFGKDRLRAGDVLELEATLLTHCQAYRVVWKGRFLLRP